MCLPRSGQRFTRALERNVARLDLHRTKDALGGELARAADAIVAIGVLVRILAQLLDEALALGRAEIRMHAEDIRRAGQLDDGNVVVRRVLHLHRVLRHRQLATARRARPRRGAAARDRHRRPRHRPRIARSNGRSRHDGHSTQMGPPFRIARCFRHRVPPAFANVRRSQHAVRNAVRIQYAQVFVDRAIALRRRVPVRRQRRVAPHHMRVAIDGPDRNGNAGHARGLPPALRSTRAFSQQGRSAPTSRRAPVLRESPHRNPRGPGSPSR